MTENTVNPAQPSQPPIPRPPTAPQKEFSNILKVKADPDKCSQEERRRLVKNLAGAIAHGIRNFGEVNVRCLSYATIAKGAKAVAIARGFIAPSGHDLFCIPHFITAKLENNEMTGICFYCFTSKTDLDKSDLYPPVKEETSHDHHDYHGHNDERGRGNGREYNSDYSREPQSPDGFYRG